MIVNEIFDSINGEVCRAGQGTMTTFVRFAGCNLQCPWCDTPGTQSFDNGQFMSPESVADVIVARGMGRVTLTGGEPLLQKDIGDLLAHLEARRIEVSIETNGTVDLRPFMQKPRRRVSFVVDCKLPSSGYFCDFKTSNLALLGAVDHLKFVVLDKDDFLTACAVIAKEQRVYGCPRYAFSPVSGQCDPQELFLWLKQKKIDAILNVQLHKVIGMR